MLGAEEPTGHALENLIQSSHSAPEARKCCSLQQPVKEYVTESKHLETRWHQLATAPMRSAPPKKTSSRLS